MDLNPAQTWLLASLPATAAELLYESREAGRMSVCIGLPRTDDELRRMMASLQLLGLCEHLADGWHRTAPKPKKEGRLF